MIVKLSGDKTVRVQFVHSAHDLNTSHAAANPGGLRQFVDNLARSLRRRVTLAEIALMDVVPGATKRSEPVTTFLPLAQGFAVCHHTDNFVKEEGRGRALLRALKVSGLSASDQELIAYEAGFGSVVDMKSKYTKNGLDHNRVLAMPSSKYSGECSAPPCTCRPRW